MPSAFPRIKFWIRALHAQGMRSPALMILLVLAVGTALSDEFLSIPGARDPVVVSMVGPLVVSIIGVTFLTEELAEFEALGARSPHLVRFARWA